MEELHCARLGLVGYEQADSAQRRLRDARLADEIPDVLLLLEHPPVYTKGRRTEPGELGMGEDWYRMQGIEVCDADRGGRVTYHGPGQLVGYPIFSLNRTGGGDGERRPLRGMDVSGYVQRLERMMIEVLGEVGIEAQLIDGLTGVWTSGSAPAPGDDGSARKIGSIGVHVSRGITTHGFAVNVNNDLQPFEWVVPCGIEGCQMTSVCRELGREQDMDGLMDLVCERFGGIYRRRVVAAGADALAERVPGLEGLAGTTRAEADDAGATVG